MIGNTLIDNSSDLKLVNIINEIISFPELEEICIATGYWDLKGTALIAEKLKPFLERENTKLKILIGKDPKVLRNDLTDEAYKTASHYPGDYIRIDLKNLELNNEEYQKAADLLIQYSEPEKQKIQIHIFKTNENDEKQFFHSKCYIFLSKQGRTCGIVGSSNFTQMGLEGNSELNFLDIDTSHIMAQPDPYSPFKGHKYWFEEKWNLSEDWTKEFVIELKNSPIGKKLQEIKTEPNSNDEKKITVLTPEDAYYKLLIEQFNQYIEFDGKIKPENYIPADPNFKKLNYQLQAVNQAFGILQRHNGMILADVVGLGKTFTALMIAKRYLIENGFSKKILIISPRPVIKSWEESIAYFDKDTNKTIKERITLTTIGTLDIGDEGEDYDDDNQTNGNIITDINDDDYGMVIIDESHRFRNSKTIAYKKIEDFLFEKKPYTVLLSATPQNNRPTDILNQLYLFEHDHRHSTITGLGVYDSNLEAYFSEKERIYEECIKDWSSQDSDGTKIPKTQSQKEQDMTRLKEISEQIRDDVLNQILIRRTRTDLQTSLYQDDIEAQKIVFPKINPPIGLPYEMTGSLAELFSRTLDIIAPKVAHITIDDIGNQDFDFREEDQYLHYYRYRAIEYLNKRFHAKYAYDSKRKRAAGGTITVKDISDRLAGLMELHLVKRLESSKDAFEESLGNLYRNTNNMIKMIKNDRVFICPDFDIHKIINSYSDDYIDVAFAEIKARAEKYNKKKNTERNAEYRAADFQSDYLSKLESDSKLLAYLIDEWAKNNQDKKRDTFIKYIESRFLNEQKNPNKKMVVFTECIATQNMLYEYLNGEYENQVLKITAENRDELQEVLNANFDANYKGVPQDKYKILLTTDVLAEGVNLHRANTLVNYDSPWNSTKLMQRLGRINRIGSTSSELYTYNFYPSTIGDKQINLYKRTLVKLQAFHNLFGEDSKIYTEDEEMVKIDRPVYEEAESLDPKIEFITDLLEFKKSYPEKYQELEGIESTIATCITNTDDDCCLSQVHDGFFRFSNDKDSIFTSPNQIEFCKSIKELSKRPISEARKTEYEDYLQKSILVFQTQRDNDKTSYKNKSKIGNKDRIEALATLKKLEENYKMSSEARSVFNNLMTSVRHNCISLIRRIINTDFDGMLEIDSTIINLGSFLNKKIGGVEPKVNFEFIIKK